MSADSVGGDRTAGIDLAFTDPTAIVHAVADLPARRCVELI